MFGLLRTGLALMVGVFHRWAGIFPLGSYSVFGFYMISGYLLTRVMQESYGYDLRGRAAFATNRFLRLYPMYWAAAACSIVLILWIGPGAVAGFHPNMRLPESFAAVAQNLAMVFPAWVPFEIPVRLVPPTWALTVEMFFYVLICIGFSRTLRRTAIWVAVSASVSITADWITS